MNLAPRIFRIILFSILLATVTNSQAQINFMEGWIITPENDTIRGLIKDCGEFRSSKACLFKENRASRTVKYAPGDISAYQIQGESYYVHSDYSLEGDSTPFFSIVLLEGELSLYHNRKNRRMAYCIQKQDSNPVVLCNKEVLVQRESYLLSYANSNTNSFMVPVYRDSLRSLFRESKKTQNQVGIVGYNHKSLINITKAYLQETCGTDDCISYEKDLNKNRKRLGFYTGIQASQAESIDDSWGTNYQVTVPIGVLYNIPLKFINDRLSFQIELIYRRLKYDETISNGGTMLERDIVSNLIGLPISLNYRFSKKRVSPTLGIGKEPGLYFNRFSNNPADGFSVYLSRGGNWFIDAGLSHDINPGLSMFTNLRLTGYPFGSGLFNKILLTDKANFYTTFIALHLGVKF